jgi:hypothetical protein
MEGRENCNRDQTDAVGDDVEYEIIGTEEELIIPRVPTKTNKKPFASKMPKWQIALRAISDARDLLNGTLPNTNPVEDQITKI